MRCDFTFSLTVTLCFPVTIFCKVLKSDNDKIVPKEFATQLKDSFESVTSIINDTEIESLASVLRILNQYENVNSIQNETKTFHNGSKQSIMEHINPTAPSSSAYEKPKKELPVALIIAGPTAAVSIFIFLCVAYYFHNAQLNKKAKRLSVTLYVPPDLNSISSNCSSPTGMLPQSHKYIPSARLSRDSDLLGPRRKSMISIHTLSLPPSIQGKRGSNWSALADQEILNLSAPRRHSTFIL